MPAVAAKPKVKGKAKESSPARRRAAVHPPITLRGFIRKSEAGGYEGICLTLNLAVHGSTVGDVEQKLHSIIVAYLQDADQDGTWDKFVPRHAPTAYYFTYYLYRILGPLLSAFQDFKLYEESAPCAANA
jgi:hypothetical protein